MRRLTHCPICDSEFAMEKNHIHSHSLHHIFCKQWYPGSTLVVSVCRGCHDEFNRDYQWMATRKWSKYECIRYWSLFCQKKGRNANCIYPQLIKYLNAELPT